MGTFISNSLEETEQEAKRLAGKVEFGCVVGLIGPLGSGKTHFSRAFAEALGVTERVSSPTYTLVQEYRSGGFPLFHLDLYRLENPNSIAGAGLEEYLFQPEGVTLVEWADRYYRFDGPNLRDAWGQICDGPHRFVFFEIRGEKERCLRYEDFGY